MYYEKKQKVETFEILRAKRRQKSLETEKTCKLNDTRERWPNENQRFLQIIESYLTQHKIYYSNEDASNDRKGLKKERERM